MSDEYGPEDLDGLLELQRIDSRIARLDHLLGELPEQQALEETRDRIRELTEAQDATRVELERVEPEQRRHEREIDVLGERKEAEQVRMYSGDITNPRELQAAKNEVESVQRRIDEHEESLLEVMEAVEALETTLSTRQEQIGALEASAAEQETERDEAAASHVAEKAELEVARERQREALPEALVARYDATRTRLGGGAAVGELVDGQCTACRIEMPMVEARELRDGPPLNECPECRRLLIVRH